MREPSEPSLPRVSRASTQPVARADERARLLRARAALPSAARAIADAAIAARLDALVRRLTPAVIAGYWPMRDEPELVGALTRWHEAGIAIALPRVIARDAPLGFGVWHPGAPMAVGPFGTRHPQQHLPLTPDLLILPCVGFDAGCHRLGYGGGFYDRTLAALPGARTAGVAYDVCEARGFEPGPHDRPLDWVFTERRSFARG